METKKIRIFLFVLLVVVLAAGTFYYTYTQNSEETIKMEGTFL